MQFGFKTLMAAGIMAAGLTTSAASAMPIAGAGVTMAPQGETTLRAEKTAVVCIGRCYRRFGSYRPGFRYYRGYRPYAYYRVHPRYGYYR